MPFKCLSNQIDTERYVYLMAAGENIFLPMKARHKEVIIVHSISVYNPTQNGFTHLYKVMERRGRLCRLDYLAALATVTVHLFDHEIYMIDGDEAGIALTPSVAGDMVQVTIQIIRLRDDEFYKTI